MTISINSLIGTTPGGENGNVTLEEKLKWLGLALILLLILLVIDFFVNQSAKQFAESDLLPELPIETQMKQDQGSETKVLDLYSQYDLPKADEVEKEDESTTDVVDTMSLAEQNRQSGLLSKLYISDAIYRLSGIVRSGRVKSGDFKAALSVSYTQLRTDSEKEVEQLGAGTHLQSDANLTTRARKTNISLSKGDKLGPYRVESVDSRRLVLADNGRRLWLELFVPIQTK
ncbi:hypothetical protein [Shewanella atlantica]|uniref:hypothetical protein n=1 Tax=Shewanella atlantica TaxID=271099 RepID=UPI0037370D2B